MNKAKTSPTFPGTIRIIGGEWRGRKLKTLERPGLRPTPNRVRETLFNWLQMWIQGSVCLDLFSGTGSLCLEALSRGAKQAVMVEKDPQVAELLRENLARFSGANGKIVVADALSYLSGEATPMDLVFVDPPFAQAVQYLGPCVDRLCEGWLKPGSRLYLEEEARQSTYQAPKAFTPLKDKTTGQVRYRLYEYRP